MASCPCEAIPAVLGDTRRRAPRSWSPLLLPSPRASSVDQGRIGKESRAVAEVAVLSRNVPTLHQPGRRLPVPDLFSRSGWPGYRPCSTMAASRSPRPSISRATWPSRSPTLLWATVRRLSRSDEVRPERTQGCPGLLQLRTKRGKRRFTVYKVALKAPLLRPAETGPDVEAHRAGCSV